MDGEDQWTALNKLSERNAHHGERIAVLDSRMGDVQTDVDKIGEEQRRTRHDLRNQITAVEGRVIAHTDERYFELQARFDRMINTFRWVIGLSVPTICTLIGILLGKS